MERPVNSDAGGPAPLPAEQWISMSERLPPESEVVLTKIDDEGGVRNCSRLKRNGRLWFFPDGSMYVYYTPTHWAPDEASPGTRSREHE